MIPMHNASFRQSWKQQAIYPNSSKGKDLQYLRLHTSVANQNSVEEGGRGRGGEVRALGTRGKMDIWMLNFADFLNQYR